MAIRGTARCAVQHPKRSPRFQLSGGGRCSGGVLVLFAHLDERERSSDELHGWVRQRPPRRRNGAQARRGSVRHRLARALLALTFTTGLVDAVSYLALGRVFTANMTGNVVLLGFGIAGSGGLPVVAPIVSVGAFLIGAGAGGMLVRRMAKRHPVLVARALAIETCLLATAAVVSATTTVHPGDASAYALIVLMASAMGVRNAVVRSIGERTSPRRY